VQQALMLGNERFLPEPHNTRGWPRTRKQLDWALLVVRDGLSWYGAARKIFSNDQTGNLLGRKLAPFLAYLQERKNALAEREFDATNDRVLREVAAIGLADRLSFARPVMINNLRHWIGKDPADLTDVQRIAVHSWTSKEIPTDEGPQVDFRYRLHGKKAALEFLGKHLGMLSEHMLMEMISRRTANSIEDYSDVPTDQLALAIAKLEEIKDQLRTKNAIESTAEVVPREAAG
jgi:hypothetical protein